MKLNFTHKLLEVEARIVPRAYPSRSYTKVYTIIWESSEAIWVEELAKKIADRLEYNACIEINSWKDIASLDISNEYCVANYKGSLARGRTPKRAALLAKDKHFSICMGE